MKIPDSDAHEVPSNNEDTLQSQDLLERNEEDSAAVFASFEDLTLSEVISRFIRMPLETYRSLINVAGSRITFPELKEPAPVYKPVEQSGKLSFSPDDVILVDKGYKRQQMKLGLYFSAFIMSFWGSALLVSAERRYESDQLHQGAPFLLAGFLIWLFAEVYDDWQPLKDGWSRLRAGQGKADVKTEVPPNIDNALNIPWQGIHPVRVFAGIGVIVFGLLAWLDSTGNQFHFIGFWSWVISIILIIIVMAPASWSPSRLLPRFSDRISKVRLMGSSTFIALVVIMLLAAYFRLNNLQGIPPEMTSDHIEKLLDSQRVVEGDRDIFFTNNGGREPFQMYAMALFSQLPGLGINFTTLKLLAVVESLCTIPVLWWLGREVVGEKDRQLGNVVGLLLAALVAVSYWDVAITRLSLRIILTPLVASLLLIFLSRAIRHNRRGDYILAGLVLGFGLYTYQAVRMLPVVIVVGVLIAIIYHLPRWKDIGSYIFHLGVLVVVSFIVFIPLFRFSVDYPEFFWMRTAGRLLGDEVIQETDSVGNIVERNATVDERLDAFRDNLGVLVSNIRNALLMYNWKGDVAWINGVPNYPVMDTFTGALLIVGLAGWLAFMIRTRDPVHLLVPVMVLIMLLPSALSIAAPIENPSATRASGSLPPVYLIAALPLALIAIRIYKLLGGRKGLLTSVAVVMVVILGAYTLNADTYFHDYLQSYKASWKSHSAPGRVLRGFAMSDGAYGNAFIIHHPHWLDHRIVGLEGGIIDWTNAIISLDKVPDFLNDAWRCVDNKYRFEPALDILFFVNREDAEAERQLQEWFPEGHMILFDAPNINDVFKVYRVPALGFDNFRQWIDDHKVDPRCWTGN